MFFKLLKGALSPANCARKMAGPLIVLIVFSTPACIHDEVLRCAFLRGIRSQKQRHVRDVIGKHPRLQTLTGHDFLLELGRIPQFDLPLGPDGSRRQRVDAYAEGAEFTGQNPGQPRDGGFTRVVYGKTGLLESPNNGAKINDGSAAEALHLREDGLSCEEHVAQVHRDPVIPVRWRNLLQRVTVVVACIVDEHTDVAKREADFFNSALERGDVADVAGDEEWRRSSLLLDLVHERPARFVRNIHESNARPLQSEGLREGRTDAASSAGNEDRFAGEARVDRRSGSIHRNNVTAKRSTAV